jgi:WD40 repeat protein
MTLKISDIVCKALTIALLLPLFSTAQDTLWVRKNAPTQKETYSVSFSADGNKVFSGSECSPSYLRIFNTTAGNMLWEYELGSSLMCVQGVKFSSDGTNAAAMEEMGNLLIFDYTGSTPSLTHTVSTGTSGAFALDFSPDGSKIATACINRKMNIYRVSDGALLHTVDAHASWVMSVDWSATGNVIVTGGSDNLIKLWDTTGHVIRTMSGHSASVQSVHFSNDGTYIVSSSKDKTIKIWETATGNLVRTLSGHSGYVMQADISDDGMRIVSGSEDSTIRIWEFSTGNLLHSFSIPDAGKVYSVDFSSNNRYVAAGTSNGDVQLWDLNLHTSVSPVLSAPLKVAVVPNPFTNQLLINAQNYRLTQITIADLSGRIVANYLLSGDVARLDLSELLPGNYLATIYAGRNKASTIIIKN